jgi:hypothetical protein
LDDLNLDGHHDYGRDDHHDYGRDDHHDLAMVDHLLVVDGLNLVCRPGYEQVDHHLVVDDLHQPHRSEGRRNAESRSVIRLDSRDEGRDLEKAFALLYSQEQVELHTAATSRDET